MVLLNLIPTTDGGVVYITLPTAGLFFCAPKQDPTLNISIVQTPTEAGIAQFIRTQVQGTDIWGGQSPVSQPAFYKNLASVSTIQEQIFRPQCPWCWALLTPCLFKGHQVILLQSWERRLGPPDASLHHWSISFPILSYSIMSQEGILCFAEY